MTSEPAVEVAGTSAAGDVDSFFRKVVPSRGDDRVLFVGLDVEGWSKAGHGPRKMSRWIKDFNATVLDQRPNQFPLTTVIILAWPQTLPGQLDQHEQFRQLVLSGCKLRHKRLGVYPVDEPTLVTHFRRDLEEEGWLRLPDTSSPPSPLDPPKFSTEEEEREQEQILAFYGNPPFRWSAADKKRVFPKSPP